MAGSTQSIIPTLSEWRNKIKVHSRCRRCSDTHCMESVHIRSFLARFFPHSDWISLRIQSEWGKMRTRITPNKNTFYVVTIFTTLCVLIFVVDIWFQKSSYNNQLIHLLIDWLVFYVIKILKLSCLCKSYWPEN